MTYLVDTDYIIDYLKGRQNSIDLLRTLLADGLALSIITVAEVYEGIYYGNDQARHEAAFRSFLRGVRVLGITHSVARQFALIRGQLRIIPQGKMLTQPKNNYDLFIAATAILHRLTLVTRNIKDYDLIPHLKIYR